MFEKRNEQQDKENGLRNEFMEVSRCIAVRAKNIRENLDKVKKKEDRESKKKALEQIEPIIKLKEADIKSSIHRAKAIFNSSYEDPVLWSKGRDLGDDYGDQICRLSDKWDEFENIWHQISPLKEKPEGQQAHESSTDEQRSDTPAEKHTKNTKKDEGKGPEGVDIFIEKADDLDNLLCSIISHSNLVTISSRLNECLGDLWPGQKLNFYDQFSDELCKKECSKWFLDYYNSHPAMIDGVVIPSEGVIIHVSPKKWRQFLSFILVAFISVLGIVVAWFSAMVLLNMHYSMTLAVPQGFTIANVTNTTADLSSLGVPNYVSLAIPFAICYGFILVGAIAHILIGALKQQRKGSENLAIEGWIRWFHVNEIKNFFASFSLYIAFFGLILIFKTTDYVTAFLIGYSIDSFIDVFLNRFEQTTSSKTADLSASISKNNGTSASRGTQ